MHHQYYELLAFQTEVLMRWFPTLINQKITILDYGCGSGIMADFVSKAFFRAQLWATDNASNILKQAHKDFAHINFFDLNELEHSVPPESFDLMYASCVFHHIPLGQHAELMQKLLSLLKPTGTLIIFELNPLNYHVRKEFKHNSLEKNATLLFPWHFYRYSLRLQASSSVRFCYDVTHFASAIFSFLPFAQLYACRITKR